jgi:anthranilate/para-aminobenzoate synthase component II
MNAFPAPEEGQGDDREQQLQPDRGVVRVVVSPGPEHVAKRPVAAATIRHLRRPDTSLS